MPLQLKTLSEVALELGMPESEIRALAQLGKIRSLMKKGKMAFAPDEVAKIKRLRKTIPESARSTSGTPAAPPKPAAKPAPGRPGPKPPPRRSI